MFWEVLRPGFEPGSVTLEFRSGNFSQFEDERPLCFSGSIPCVEKRKVIDGRTTPPELSTNDCLCS